jgi:L-alanine-DL-glutamate epimerase-like enolase superfamily enzyme
MPDSTLSPDSSSLPRDPIRISELEIAVCPVDMPYPVRLGRVLYATRDYIALRIRTDAGIEGVAIGYTRGTPVAGALQELARDVLGRDALMVRAIVTDLKRSHIPGASALIRALSLIDVGLWDIVCKVAGLPLYRVLGGYRNDVPVLVVGGYFKDRRTVEDIEEEVAQLARAGYHIIKVVLPASDARDDQIYLTRLREAIDPRVDLAVDAHSAWTTLDEAIAACRRIDELGLAFIEDPFAPQSWRLTSELQHHIRTPIAMGEDVSGVDAYRDVLDAVSILRVDATASGGLTDVITAVQTAAALGRSAIPHVFASLHAQLAGAFPNVPYAEIIPAEAGADPIGRLMRSEPTIKDGHMFLDDRPGNGIDLDWDAVTRLCSDMIRLA